MIKVATEKSVHEIEDILRDAVIWMFQNNIPNLWNEKNIQWEVLSKSYKISDFFICYINNEPVGCMALTKVDQTYWSDIEPGKSVYLHKLAVKREVSGRGISKELINFAKQYAAERGITTLRLDCNVDREKLRAIYEREGFKYVKTTKNSKGYQLALYVCKVK